MYVYIYKYTYIYVYIYIYIYVYIYTYIYMYMLNTRVSKMNKMNIKNVTKEPFFFSLAWYY